MVRDVVLMTSSLPVSDRKIVERPSFAEANEAHPAQSASVDPKRPCLKWRSGMKLLSPPAKTTGSPARSPARQLKTSTRVVARSLRRKP
jgi:hypothetical protein